MNNGCGRIPARGGRQALNHSPGARRPPATRNLSPRNRSPHTLAPPGTRNSASLGLWGRYGGGPGLGPGGPAPRPQGNRRYGPASRPRPCASLSRPGPPPSRPPPALAGSPSPRASGCSRSPSPVPAAPARRRLPGPVESSKPGASRTGRGQCQEPKPRLCERCGRADAGPRVSAFSPPPPLAALCWDPERLFVPCGGAAPDATRPPSSSQASAPHAEHWPFGPTIRPRAGAPPTPRWSPPLQPQLHANKPHGDTTPLRHTRAHADTIPYAHTLTQTRPTQAQSRSP